MANHLPSTLDFAKTEEEICAKWAAEDTFKRQDSLSFERGDKVRMFLYKLGKRHVLLQQLYLRRMGIYLTWK